MAMTCSNNILTDEEFVVLYNLKKSKSTDFPYWKYSHFNLDIIGFTKTTSIISLTFYKFQKK